MTSTRSCSHILIFISHDWAKIFSIFCSDEQPASPLWVCGARAIVFGCFTNACCPGHHSLPPSALIRKCREGTGILSVYLRNGTSGTAAKHKSKQRNSIRAGLQFKARLHTVTECLSVPGSKSWCCTLSDAPLCIKLKTCWPGEHSGFFQHWTFFFLSTVFMCFCREFSSEKSDSGYLFIQQFSLNPPRAAFYWRIRLQNSRRWTWCILPGVL